MSWIILQIGKAIAAIFGIDITKAQKWAIGILALAVLIIVGVIFNQCSACRSKNEQKKIEELKTDVITKKVEANVAANVVAEAANKSVNALEAVNIARNANTANTKVADAIKALCQNFPEDELCQ